MSRLYELIARQHDLRLVGLALLIAGAGSYAAQNLLAWRVAASRRTGALAAAVVTLGAGSWLATVLAIEGMFPFLAPSAALGGLATTLGLSIAGALLALMIVVRGRPGYRDPLMAGATLACSSACVLFLSVGGLTQPYRLAYDLGPVIAAMTVAAVLNGIGLTRVREARGRWQVMQGAACLTGAQWLQATVGMTSILGFSDWVAEIDKPTSLAIEPAFVVVSACGLVLLALGVVGSAIDHHFAMQAEREADRWRQLADSALEGILIHSGEVVLDANAAFCALMGMSLAALRARHVSDLFRLKPGQPAPWDLPEALASDVSNAGESHAPREIALQAMTDDAIPVEVVPRRITYKNSCAQVLAIRDLRERREAEARIRFLAHHDGLTGLANRVLFHERIELALGLADRGGDAVPATVAVLCLDLDHFKAINDTLGHAAGDLLLRKVAIRLDSVTRATDTVARMGGDEFVIMQTGVRQPQSAAILATRLIEALCAPFDLGGKTASVGVSIGIALYHGDGSGVAELLRHADIALYRAKTDGRCTYRFYEPAMDAALRERQALEQDLRAAIGTGQLAMRYQPILDCQSGKAIGFEARAHWEHPTRGPVVPAEFMSLAEQAGLIETLVSWALEQACNAALDWPAAIRVAINVLPAQFHGDGLAAAVAGALERTGLPPSRLELELAEGGLVKDQDAALATLNALRARGVGIVLDEFGSAYSCLGILLQFPFTKIKVGRSFIAALADNGRGQAIVPALLAISRSLRVDVTAEGVETAQQLASLREQGCGSVQGDLPGLPMPADQVPEFLKAQLPRWRNLNRDIDSAAYALAGEARNLAEPFASEAWAGKVHDVVAQP